jgi:hypothetical protein
MVEGFPLNIFRPKSPYVLESEVYSPITGLYPQPVQSTPYPHTLLFFFFLHFKQLSLTSVKLILNTECLSVLSVGLWCNANFGNTCLCSLPKFIFPVSHRVTFILLYTSVSSFPESYVCLPLCFQFAVFYIVSLILSCPVVHVTLFVLFQTLVMSHPLFYGLSFILPWHVHFY